jgi:hypothetical protein
MGEGPVQISHGGSQGSNPLTSTPNLAGQSVASVERAALTARCGRSTAASASHSPAGKARSDQATRPCPDTMTTERSHHLAAPRAPQQRAILARIRLLLSRHEVDPASAQPAPRTTAKSKPTPPLAQQPAPASITRFRWMGVVEEPIMDTAGDHADPGHPSHTAAYPTATLHDLPAGHSGRGSARTLDADPGHWTPDTWTPKRPNRTLDSGRVDRHAWTLDACPTHWTPDAGRGRGHGDEAGPASAPPRPPRPAAALGGPPCSCGRHPRHLATTPARRWAPTSARLPLALPGSCSAAPPAKPRLGALLSSDQMGGA